MGNFFINKKDGLFAKVRTTWRIAVMLCLPLNLLLPTFAANTTILTASSQVTSSTCWEESAAHFGIDTTLLKAIAWKESRGRPNAIGPKLKDGNVALGLMQINTIHLKNLARFGIERDHLFDACISQKVGAWVLADCISRFGSTWKAVGCYYTGPNSSNAAAQSEYASDVQRFYVGYKKQEQQQRQIHLTEME